MSKMTTYTRPVTCPTDHAALKLDAPYGPNWLSLRLVGIQPSPGGADLELRDCPDCGSCLAIELPDAQKHNPNERPGT